MKKAKSKLTVRKTHGNDWCHLCGKRTDYCVCVWYPDNAEHEEVKIQRANYIRICAPCAAVIKQTGEQPT